ncbi:MAG: PilZ domain-containing protein [Rhodospirillales bacterium]|nr:PilZ domain-containing protein [Rhodospirillales bacterium]
MAPQNQPKTGLIENRRFPRTSVIWSGTLETNDQKYDCIAVNLSANGAKLQITQPMDDYAGAWTLTIPRLGTFNAELAWRAPEDGKQIGLMFQNPPVAVAQQLSKILSKPQDSFIAMRESA